MFYNIIGEFMKKLLLIPLLLLNISNVKAYENEYFKIDIPENYKEDIMENSTYKWIDTKSKNNDNIVITVSKNDKENKYNIEKYTDENINEYEKYLEDEINKQLEDYNLKVDVKNIKKEKLNDLDTISYDVVWPTKESTGYDINQKGYAFTSENYIYVYTFSSDSDLTNNKTLKSTINSFKILDNPIENKSILDNKLLFSLIIGASIGLIGFIISIIIKRR